MKKFLPRLLNAALLLAAPVLVAANAHAGEITLHFPRSTLQADLRF